MMHILVGAFTVVTISSIFCLFLLLKLIDDFIRLVSPSRLLLIDWNHLLNILNNEWEKRPGLINDQYKIHDLISSFMNNYYMKRKQKS
jgi:hypothetical protein